MHTSGVARSDHRGGVREFGERRGRGGAAIVLLAVALVSPPVRADVYTKQPPSKDNFMQSNAPNDNNGNSISLNMVDMAPALEAHRIRSVSTFPISPAPRRT